jgi:ABC-type Fe3+/spermidine/putrescine transport system ATPase subunit
MNRGQIEQVGAPQEIYDRPGTRFVAEFLGASNLIEAKVSNGRAETKFGEFVVANTPNGNVTLFFRPEKVVLGEGRFDGVIQEMTFAGITKHLAIRTGDALIRAATLNQDSGNWAVGSQVKWDIPSEAISAIAREASQRA